MPVDSLTRLVVAASALLSSNTRALPDAYARAVAELSIAEPLPVGARVTAAMLTALTWSEGGNNPSAIGDGGAGHCGLGIYLPNNARTAEGWTGAELDAEPAKCVAAGLHILRESIARSPASCPFCVYARGPNWRNKCVHVVDGARTEGACAAGEKPIAITLNDYRAALVRRALTIITEDP